MIDLIAADLIERFLDERIPVSHPDVGARVDVAACEGLFKGASLLFGDAAKRRASADLLVIASRFLVTLSRDQPGERLLQSAPRKTNNVRVYEDIEQEGANVFERLRPAKVKEEDADALGV